MEKEPGKAQEEEEEEEEGREKVDGMISNGEWEDGVHITFPLQNIFATQYDHIFVPGKDF